MQHTYIFEPGRWVARGSFWDQHGRAIAADGWSEIRHEPGGWALTGALRLLDPNPVEFTNRYKITPPGSPAQAMLWRSQNPALGEMSGQFVTVEDVILSTGGSPDGRHRVTECLIQQNPNRYRALGAYSEGEVLRSRWAMELTREDSPGTR